MKCVGGLDKVLTIRAFPESLFINFFGNGVLANSRQAVEVYYWSRHDKVKGYGDSLSLRYFSWLGVVETKGLVLLEWSCFVGN
jgi:hypothetical protein